MFILYIIVKICFIRVISARHCTISYNVGLAPYDVVRGPAWHRSMSSSRSAPVRYVTKQENILKPRPVPVRLSNLPVFYKSLNKYGVCFICNNSIKQASFLRTLVTFFSG